MSPSVFEFGGFRLDCARFELFLDGHSLRLERKPMELLILLAGSGGRLVTRAEIAQRLWSSEVFVDTEHGINTAIRKIRYALRDDAESPRFVQTVPGMGYRFIAPLHTYPSQDANETKLSPDSTPEIMSSEEARLTAPSVHLDSAPSIKSANPTMPLASALSVAAIAVVVLVAAFCFLRRPLPSPRISRYSQITHDGHGKYIAGTAGSRLYFNFMSPISTAQVAISGGETASIPVAVPGFIPSFLSVSPDGSSFLIHSVAAQNDVLWNVTSLGGSYRRLGTGISNGLSSTFSPDGNFVAYATLEGDLWIVKNDGTGAHKLASVGSKAEELAWSPDARTIRFTQGDRLWEINSSGSNLQQLLSNWRVSAALCCGRWTPDGKLFLFLSAESSSQSSEIWAIDERRGLVRRPLPYPVQLTNGPMRWGSLIPGKDGKEIFAVGRTPRGELARFDSKTKQLQPFLGGISADSVSFSADGKFVAYVSYPEGVLWRANRDGSNPVQLSDPPMHPGLPRWSPDGALILFCDGSSKSYLVSALGGAAPRRLLPEDHGAEYDPNWSPDGHKIVFESGAITDPGAYSFSILDMRTGRVEKVSGSAGMWSPRWSPDGRYLAAIGPHSSSLRLFDIQAQHWSALPFSGFVDFPEWSSDSQLIYFVQIGGDDRGVTRIRIKDGATERVVDLRNDHLTGGIFGFWFGLDPTGSPLLLRDISGDDIYALTLEEK